MDGEDYWGRKNTGKEQKAGVDRGQARQRPAHELRGRSIAMGLIGPIAIRPRQFDALVVPPGGIARVIRGQISPGNSRTLWSTRPAVSVGLT